jgi:DNA gyrase subunit B
LYIVEGDSAGGSGKNNRNNRLQGIMPLRGKMINCFAATEKSCLANEEVAGLLMIFDAGGPGTGRGPFDISKFQWDKIIFAADADVDGGHINSLGLRFVLRFCPDIIKAGKLYKAVPPLYSIKVGKRVQYFTNRIDYVKYMQGEFSKKYSITTLEGKALSKAQVTELLYTNIDYIYELRKIGDRYRLDYNLLELYLLNRDESVEKIGKLIKKRFRFMQNKSINKIPTAEGIINDKYNTLFMNDKLIQDSNRIIKIIDNNLYKHYKLNGEAMSIYEIMQVYEKTEPSSLTRYKGLGEMEPEELALSTILPAEDNGQRVLVRYTMEDAIKEINEIRYLESNKNKLLENLNVSRIDVLD